MTDLLNISESLTHNSFEISLPCFHRMENIEPERRENTRLINTPIVSHFPFVAGCKDCSCWCRFTCSQYHSFYFVQLKFIFCILKKWTWCLNLRADERWERTIFILKRLKAWAHLYLGGTAKTSGWSWAKPTGSPSRLSRVSTHVWTGLRWAGTTASHFLRTGREQSAGGGGRSAGGESSQRRTASIWWTVGWKVRHGAERNLLAGTLSFYFYNMSTLQQQQQHKTTDFCTCELNLNLLALTYLIWKDPRGS